MENRNFVKCPSYIVVDDILFPETSDEQPARIVGKFRHSDIIQRGMG